MKKVISFSLWGNKKIYNIGSIRNVELAKIYYPDYECWFYIHKPSVLPETINILEGFENVKIIFKEGNIINEECRPRMWRFEAIDNHDVEIMLCRDVDSRIMLREKIAVDEWLSTTKLFHIMRDHPSHNEKILAGMFGSRKNPIISNWTDLITKFNKPEGIMYDQVFLANIIYPKIVSNSVIHASFYRLEKHSKKFPINYDDDFNFVGSYVDENEVRPKKHIDLLKKKLILPRKL